jgi:hypothetical protein
MDWDVMSRQLMTSLLPAAVPERATSCAWSCYRYDHHELAWQELPAAASQLQRVDAV